MRLQVEVGASYDVPPNVVKAVIREALQERAGALARTRCRKCCWSDFGDSAITYRVRFWVSDFEADDAREGSRCGR